MKKLLLILYVSILLSGCSTLWNNPRPIITDRIVKIDNRAYERCEPLRLLEDPNELLSISLANMELYAKCVQKQDNSIKLLKEFSNYKDTK